MPAWKMKEDRAIETGRVVTLEYEGRDLSVLVQGDKDFAAVVAEYGQRLVEIVEAERKDTEFRKAGVLPLPDAGEGRERGPAPKPCGCIKKSTRAKAGKTLGLLSLGKALLGGQATPEEAARRLAICRACQATDPTGTRLYRVTDGKPYCGVPRLADLGKVYRDETKWGCGCGLAWKAGMADAGCPIREW